MKFLESEIVQGKEREDNCRFHVIPAPMESSVSYGGGTAAGPKAILEASDQLEAWDNSQSVAVIRESGIYTTPAIDCKSDPETILGQIEDAVTRALLLNAIPVVLGGEHTVTLGALRALKKHLIQPSCANQTESPHNQAAPFGIIQIDAHADLRDTYQGSRLSHACVMRRAVDDLCIPLFQIGVRAISREEVIFRQKNNICFIDAQELYFKGLSAPSPCFTGRFATLSDEIVPADFPQKIYITLDVDGLDPSVIRATGTPVPGGLGWYDTMMILEKIISRREVIGFDVVELAPIKGDHASDFAAAQLAYSVMGMVSI